jgi:hypothetical protein
MQGPQYAHKILYSDIDTYYLLERDRRKIGRDADGEDLYEYGRSSFVISLRNSVRQSAQKYANLVIEMTNIEYNITLKPSQSELNEKFGEGVLEKDITMKMAHLMAKLFKTISKVKVSHATSSN